jgi:hypothetical protein
MGLRLSDSVKLGRFRIGASVPLSGRGRTWVSAGTRTPFGWLKLSAPVGGRKRRIR